MRFTCRTFVAAILFMVAVGASFSSAQEPGTAPPPAVKPATELPQIPLVKPEATVQPAPLMGDPSAVAVDPVPSTAAAPPVALKPVTTTTAKHVVKKTSRKLAAKPPVEVNETVKTIAPAASVAAVEPPASLPPANPPAVDVAPVPAPVAKAAAPAAPPLKAAAGDPGSEVTKSAMTMGTGGWILFGIGVVVLFGAITLIRRRRANAQKHRSITDFSPTTGEIELQPVLSSPPLR